jgi:hypothetical protein
MLDATPKFRKVELAAIIQHNKPHMTATSIRAAPNSRTNVETAHILFSKLTRAPKNPAPKSRLDFFLFYVSMLGRLPPKQTMGKQSDQHRPPRCGATSRLKECAAPSPVEARRESEHCRHSSTPKPPCKSPAGKRATPARQPRRKIPLSIATKSIGHKAADHPLADCLLTSHLR